MKGLLLSCLVALPCGAPVPYWTEFQAVAGPKATARAAQARAESAFNPRAVSPVGAQGLAQFMPGTWRWAIQQGWVPSGSSPFDIAPAICGQHRYMGWLEARTGEQGAAWGAYNAGLGNIRRAQELARSLGLSGARPWMRTLQRVTGEAHARETVGYVQCIEGVHLPWVRQQVSNGCR